MENSRPPAKHPKAREQRHREKPSHLYGPVPSRRLGFSLGVDVLPFKTCSMDCVYCQLGSAGRTTVRRRIYVPVDTVLAEIKAALASGQKIEAITFSGSGEPTLHSGIGKIIRGIKQMTDIPVAVLTNSSALVDEPGRREILEADIVVPSLDAATPKVFRKVNRPHQSLSVERIVAGLARFRQEYRGEIWLEIMLVKGVNDAPDHLRRLKDAADRIQPDKIQLNTVARPPAEKTAKPLAREDLEKIRGFFGEKAEIIADFAIRDGSPAVGDPAKAILATVRRRPVTAEDIARSLGLSPEDIAGRLARLLAAGKIKTAEHKGRFYFEKT